MVGARFVDSWAGDHFRFRVRSFIEPDFLKTMYHSTIYHSNLSDQSALEIGLGQSVSPSVFTVAVYTQLEVGTQRPFQDIEEEVGLGLDSELHYFSIFHGE